MTDAAHALNRYGHHDQDCEQRVYHDDTPCSCGFNEALQAALNGAVEIPVRPTIYRQRGGQGLPTREEILSDYPEREG